jgi:hypothetical protein
MKKLLIILTVAAAGIFAACSPSASSSPTVPAVSSEPSMELPSESSGASMAPSESSGSSMAPSDSAAPSAS